MEESSQKYIKQYRELWNKIVKIFEIPNDKERDILSAYGNGIRFQSSYEAKEYLMKNGIEGITFQLLYNFEAIDENVLLEQEKEITDIVQQFKNCESKIRKYIAKIKIRWTIERLQYMHFEEIIDLKNTAKKLGGKMSVSLTMKRCVFQEGENVFNVAENNREDWSYVATFIRQAMKTESDERNGFLSFNVALSDEHDATNLRYFLPIWRTYKDKILNLHISADEGQRSRPFFQMLKEDLGSLVKIEIAPEKIYPLGYIENVSASNVFPLLCFKKDDGNKFPDRYDILIVAYFLYSIEEKNYKGSGNEQNKLMRDTMLCFFLKKLGIKFYKTNDDKVGEVYKTKYDDKEYSLNDIAVKIIEENKKYKEAKKHKKEVTLLDFAALKDFLVLIKENKFEILIFLHIIRNHIKSKTLFLKLEEKWTLNEIIVEKIWLNSKTYAEGLWQLIENAQQHSNGQVAYFGMRIYKADPNETMSAVAEEAQTRTALWRKFWHDAHNTNNIFNEKTEDGQAKYPDFIEFYVLDAAINDTSNTSGIVNEILNPSPDRIKDSILNVEGKAVIEKEGISGIFKLNEEHYNVHLDFYIQHYGMRWFRHYIDTLNGIMEIYSPYNPNDGEEKFGQNCCYSNVFKNLEKTVPYYRNLYSTEYSILVPLEYTQR